MSDPGTGQMQPQGVGGPSLAGIRSALHGEVAKVVVGAESTVDAVLVAMSVGGHVLLQGPPGVAKTLLASTVARACGLTSRRIQFTPDLLPSDVTGTMTLTGGELAFRQGPVFTNILLADEINRTPPKTQAALLEAMQENQVSVDGTAYVLPRPFVVLATQNPIEYEGTYPLPEAQLDRFLVQLTLSYPSAGDEEAMLRLRHTGVRPSSLDDVQTVVSAEMLAAAAGAVDAVSVAPPVITYVSAIVRRTRELPSVMLGASPRAAVHLLAAARGLAALRDRAYVTPDDVAALATPVLAHRLVLTPEAELDRFTPQEAIGAALSGVAVPR